MPGRTRYRLPLLWVLALAGCRGLLPPELYPELARAGDLSGRETGVQEALVRQHKLGGVAVAIVRKDELGALRLESVPVGRRAPWIRAFGDRFQNVVFLSPFLSRGATATVSELRSDAARLAADTLLLVAHGHDSSSRPNVLSLAYLTLIGGFLVPGTNCANLTVGIMALIDVKTGSVLSVREDEQRIEASATLVSAGSTHRRIGAIARSLVLDRSRRHLERLLRESERMK
ncbi:MAG: hypothetical protein ACE5F1_00250 [Planctomycetota bacterium]